jgi:hypothetical protein
MAVAATELFNRDSWAHFSAKRHLSIDNGIDEIYYLPKNSPEREIRFLEVNRLVSEMSPLAPIDFGVDIGGADEHKLFVLDVTPAQWEQIKSGTLALPDDWALEGKQRFDRNSS